MGKVASVMANGAGAVGWRQGLSWERKAKRRETRAEGSTPSPSPRAEACALLAPDTRSTAP